MKIRNTRLSKRTLALLAATALLFAGGGFAGTRAALTYFSEDYTAAFELEHLQVHLVENGVDVCHSENDIYTVHRTDGHQAAYSDVLELCNLIEACKKGILCQEAALGLLVGGVVLKKHIHRLANSCSRVVDLPEKLHRVNALDHVDQRNHLPHFVRLEVSDHVDLHVSRSLT